MSEKTNEKPAASTINWKTNLNDLHPDKWLFSIYDVLWNNAAHLRALPASDESLRMHLFNGISTVNLNFLHSHANFTVYVALLEVFWYYPLQTQLSLLQALPDFNPFAIYLSEIFTDSVLREEDFLMIARQRPHEFLLSISDKGSVFDYRVGSSIILARIAQRMCDEYPEICDDIAAAQGLFDPLNLASMEDALGASGTESFIE